MRVAPAVRCSNRKTGLEWRERLPLEFGRYGRALRAARPTLPRATVMGWRRAGACRIDFCRRQPGRARQRRGDVLGLRRLCPAGSQARRGCRFRGEHGRLDSRDPFQRSRWIFRSTSCPKRCPIMSVRRGAIPMARRSGCRWRARSPINTMTAGERVFVDLLPDSWNGPPPSLPHEVIRELAERARAAERALRQQRAAGRGEEASARPRARIGAADLRPLRVRNARWRRRFLRAERAEADAVCSMPVLSFRSGGRQGGGAIQHRLDQTENRGRRFRGRSRADRRCRRAFVPRGKELHRRRRPFSKRINPRWCRRCRSSARARGSRSAAGRSSRRRRWQPAPAAVPGEHRAAAPRHPPSLGAAEAIRSNLCSRRRRRSPKQANIEHQTRRRRRNIGSRPARQADSRAQEHNGRRSRRRMRGGHAAKYGTRRGRSRRTNQRQPRPANRPWPRDAAPSVEADTQQRRAAPDIFLCGADAGGAVPPRRHGVAGVRFPKPIDLEPIRNKGGSLITDVSALAAGERPGDPHPAQPPATAVADRRRISRARRELDGHIRRYHADAVAAADRDPQHHRSRACQRHRAARRPGLLHRLVDPDAGDTLHGGHGAAAGSRLRQAAGFCRVRRCWNSIHGVAIRPNSDDVTAEIASDKIMLAGRAV